MIISLSDVCVSAEYHRLVGLVVKASASRAEDPGIFPGSIHTSDSKISTPVAALPGAWRYRVSTGTGRPGVSILWLGKVESLICNFYLSVAARKIVWADPSLRYTSLLLERQATTNEQTAEYLDSVYPNKATTLASVLGIVRVRRKGWGWNRR